MTDDRILKRGEWIRVRETGGEVWSRAVVAVVGEGSPCSVALVLLDPVRCQGGIILNALPLTVDYEAQTVRGLFGGAYEIEVQ